MIMSNSSCWTLVSFAVLYCCDVLLGKDLSDGQDETIVDHPFTQCLAIRR